ncbi:hypothetical protein DH86_00001436 [Scytalidium sp. 3C]|nr:hypothetical protein DH86_00001436 [Scytalidium sp. 3C]
MERGQTLDQDRKTAIYRAEGTAKLSQGGTEAIRKASSTSPAVAMAPTHSWAGRCLSQTPSLKCSRNLSIDYSSSTAGPVRLGGSKIVGLAIGSFDHVSRSRSVAGVWFSRRSQE